MGIVECLDRKTGRTWVAAYQDGPHMGLVVDDWRGAKEVFDTVAEDNTRIDVPLSGIPRLEALPSVNPDDYPILKTAGVLKREGLN